MFLDIILFLHYSYPLFLIVITWISLQVYSRHFQLLVWLWNKVSEEKTNKDSKTTMIDIFAIFFLLSYTKFVYISMILLAPMRIVRNDKLKYAYVSADPKILSDFSREHIPYAVMAGMFF